MTARTNPDKASAPKLLCYLLGLGSLVFVSAHFGDAGYAPPRLASQTGTTDPLRYEVLRVGRPVEEVREDLALFGIPWFLRNAGVQGSIDTHDPALVSFTLRRGGKLVGRYVERPVRIDDDRTKVLIGFEPADRATVAAIAAPIATQWTPPELLRVVMREHLRSRFADEGFDVNVLAKDRATMRNLLTAVLGESRNDHFELNHRDEEDATIRRAYREELRASSPR